ncbi:helix-turn-helix transcriptional regulator [Paraburkholderia sp. CNPSo 3274]|uniref:helix-turn-helix transcriptional regulator n=1 Tax=Paraburkholderia sp. CNPSo 3274 TaxID=2940932 RepID=UPI0020B88FD7|nr:helix-turn-helix transcriptional regulator [Paraburkholderia sp. CNPSo 3274]MCP3705516.1 helix-turn-helix transcriptional regulator [Paraburkholderia sp. CNPSo 3274]
MGPTTAAHAAAIDTVAHSARVGLGEPDETGGLIDAIYDAGFDAQRWPDVCARIAQRIGAQHVNLTMLPPESTFSLAEWDGIDASFAHSYAQHYGGFDPLVPQVRRWAAGTLVTDTMIHPQGSLEHSAFVQEWVRPQRFYTVAFANVLREGDMAAVLGALRHETRFYSEDELDALRTLLPHLRNALRVQRHTARTLASHDQSADAPADALDALAHGVLIVDADAHIVFANRAATAQLARANGLRTEHAALSAATAAATQQLRSLIARAAGRDVRGRTGGAMLIARQPPDEPLQALISPLGAHRNADYFAYGARAGTAMLIVIDPQSSRRGVETRLIALFGLTPAEARVACEVGKGLNPKDVAEALQVLPSTVRTHLHHVFAKTTTRRQAELMRLIAQLAIARGD